jgi:alpha-D-xyloside xylohydrolase
MVAPIFEESGDPEFTARREIYLPAGGWYDYWAGERHFGPSEIEYEAAFDTLPVFVRTGSIIPTGPDIKWIEGPPDPEITLNLYPGKFATFDLIEDDGVSLDYQRARYARTHIEFVEKGELGGRECLLVVSKPQGEYEGMPTARKFFICIHGRVDPESVLLGGGAFTGEFKLQDGVSTVGPIEAAEGFELEFALVTD